MWPTDHFAIRVPCLVSELQKLRKSRPSDSITFYLTFWSWQNQTDDFWATLYLLNKQGNVVLRSCNVIYLEATKFSPLFFCTTDELLKIVGTKNAAAFFRSFLTESWHLQTNKQKLCLPYAVKRKPAGESTIKRFFPKKFSDKAMFTRTNKVPTSLLCTPIFAQKMGDLHTFRELATSLFGKFSSY